jgi:hypothetical protein
LRWSRWSRWQAGAVAETLRSAGSESAVHLDLRRVRLKFVFNYATTLLLHPHTLPPIHPLLPQPPTTAPQYRRQLTVAKQHSKRGKSSGCRTSMYLRRDAADTQDCNTRRRTKSAVYSSIDTVLQNTETHRGKQICAQTHRTTKYNIEMCRH